MANKKVWTDEERLKLAAKLDSELEDCINQLEKKSYTERWPEDRWEEEMDKHPFFMKKPLEPGEEVPALLEGLQQLKYSADENSPEELAQNYKEDGNFNYKHKKYRMAIISFTEGIRTKCKDQELMAQLYNNRAASHYMLKNYRSSLNDSKQALKLKPDYVKALERAANCCFHIKDYDQCIELCDRLLDICSNDNISHDTTVALNLKSKATTSKKVLQRDQRKQEIAEKKKQMIETKIISAVKDRGIKVKSNILSSLINDNDLYAISMDENDRLRWPVIFIYPQVKQTEIVTHFHEDTTIKEQMEIMFKELPSWDPNGLYKPDRVEVYFKGKNENSYHLTDISKSLGNIIIDERFDIAKGISVFWVLLRGSDIKVIYS